MSKLGKVTRTIKFYSDSNFAHFKDAAEWRHASNRMAVDDKKLTITFEGAIDAILVSQGRDFGGEWQ